MATSTKGSGQKAKGRSQRPNPDPYRIPVGPAVLGESNEESVMGVLGWIVAMVLVAFMLPLLAMLYLDNLKLNKQAEESFKKLERIERRIERKQREKDVPDNFSDNPIFDRLRRPFPLRMSEPKKLGEP